MSSVYVIGEPRRLVALLVLRLPLPSEDFLSTTVDLVSSSPNGSPKLRVWDISNG